MHVRWARSKAGKWHAFIFFPDTITLASPCSSGMKVPETRLLMDKPITPGTEDICKECNIGVRGMKRRYMAKDDALTADGLLDVLRKAGGA